MKVVYLSIRKQIERAIDTAAHNGRTIDHIELNAREVAELQSEMAWFPFIKDGDHYMGVRIKTTQARDL